MLFTFEISICAMRRIRRCSNARSEECVLISADTDFGAPLARTRAVKPSVILLRRLVGRRATDQSALIQANFLQIADDLAAGAVVVVGDDWGLSGDARLGLISGWGRMCARPDCGGRKG
jgi:hypothetical protein